jgi:hypothetical protein
MMTFNALIDTDFYKKRNVERYKNFSSLQIFRHKTACNQFALANSCRLLLLNIDLPISARRDPYKPHRPIRFPGT